MAPLSKRPSQLGKPLPPASSSEEAEEDQEKEEQFDSGEEKEIEIKKPTKKKRETKPPSSSQEEAEEKGGGGGGSESDFDHPAPQVVVVTKSKRRPESERAHKKLKKKAEEESKKMKRKKEQEEEESKKKKKKKKVEEEEEEEESKKMKMKMKMKMKKKVEVEEEEEEEEEEEKKPVLFQRLWSEEDELVILKGIADYYANKGADPASDVNAFLEIINKSLQFKQASKAQLADKMKRLKNRYFRNAVRKGKNGGERTFSNPHETTLYNLSKSVWGKEASNSRRLRTQPSRAVVAHPLPAGHVTYDQFQQCMLETRTIRTILEALLTVHFSPEQIAEIMARARTGHA